MRKMVLFLIILVLGINIVSAERTDQIPISIKLNFVNNNNDNVLSGVILYYNGTSSTSSGELFFSTTSSSSEISYIMGYKINNNGNTIGIPIRVKSIFYPNNNSMMNIEVRIGTSLWNQTKKNIINNDYKFDFVLSYLLTDEMLNSSTYTTVNGFSVNISDINATIKNALNSPEFLDRISKNMRTEQEDFSSTFIQYFAEQYEPKITELKEKDNQIESLRNDIRLKDEQFMMMRTNYTYAKNNLDNAQYENFLLSLFTIILLILLTSLFAIKKGYIKTFRGVS